MATKYLIRFLQTLSTITFLFIVPQTSSAQTIVSTPSATITNLVGGWGAPDMFVQLSGQTGTSITNPGGCTGTDGYEIAGSDSYAQLFSSMLLTAYAGQLNIQLVISGCYGNRPHVIGLSLHR